MCDPNIVFSKNKYGFMSWTEKTIVNMTLNGNWEITPAPKKSWNDPVEIKLVSNKNNQTTIQFECIDGMENEIILNAK